MPLSHVCLSSVDMYVNIVVIFEVCLISLRTEKEEKAKFKFESREKLKDEKKEKVKDKDKEKSKEKEKEKVKEKDKDKKDKKLTKIQSTVTSGVPFEEIFTLGVALPIFGVPLQQSVERSRCHDDTGLPLVVRDSIDYLQAHGLKSKDIYRTEPDKIKFQQLRKLFTDRGPTFPYHWDVPVACAMLKAFISELPESILTQELHGQFEQATAIAEPQREATMTNLINKLPNCNHNLLAWLMRHFQHVVSNEQVNQANIQTIMAAMGAALNMSLNLLTYLVTKSEKLFPNVRLTKYVPPLHSLPADFPDSAAEMSAELRKQESLLSQIHAEMHAGFITAARDQQLWEAQRIVTQLKRKLRSVQKSTEPNAVPTQQSSVDEKQPDEETTRVCSQPTEAEKPVREVERPGREVERPVREVERPVREVERPVREVERPIDAFEPKESPLDQDATFEAEFEDNFDFKPDKKTTTDETQATEPVQDKPKLTEKELKVLRLELENAEYLQLKSLLQAKINSEQFEIVKLRSYVALKNKQECNLQNNKDAKENSSVDEQELKQRLMKENALLEQKRLNLINQIFQERVACIQLKIELAMKEILSKS
ncbi:ralA-binding protein 1 isoform X2 [Bombyx mori]|uniref:Rho-GAP domain-containing protein n=1 Tax=Bombyx mori TaxID=7091 RepID=A0A8R2GAX1_BOMMO|nr:ralA-binding protein 1 isoform X2 [Bombyx mori]